MPQSGEADDEVSAEGVRHRNVGGEESQDGSPAALKSERKDTRSSSMGERSWKTTFNAVRANIRLQDKGLDVAFKDESLQRPDLANGLSQRRRPIFGEIQYPGDHSTKYCVIGAGSNVSSFYERVASHPDVWNLEAPRLILSIMGGAAFFQLDADIEASFSEGLVRVAKQTGAWVITGGTNSGVMAMAGKAMAAHDKRRTVRLIGVTSFGSLKSRWRAALDFLPPEDEHRVVRMVDAPTLTGEEPREDKPLAGAQEHHTHMIFCDGGKRGLEGFGQESDFRAHLEEHVGRMFKPDETALRSMNPRASRKGSLLGDLTATRSLGAGSDDPVNFRRGRMDTEKSNGGDAEAAEALRVMILVNGGPISFQSVALSLEHQCPVVVCRGSGRAADFIAALKDKPDGSYEEAWKAHMTAGADAKSWTDKWGKDTPDGLGMLRKIIQNDSVVIFVHTDRLEDVVIGAVLKNIWTKGSEERLRSALQDSLDLAVKWQCTKHCRDLCSRLMSLDSKSEEVSIRWILDRFTSKDWVEADASHIVRVMYEVFGTSMRNFDTSHLAPKIQWSNWPTFEKCRDTAAAVFIWLIENGASSEVIDVMWLQQEFPAHAALAAASVLRQMAVCRRHHVVAEKPGARTCEEEADRYEGFAIKLLQFPNDPIEFLFRQSSNWAGKNLLYLAHDLECKSFVMEPRYVSAINLLWFTPGPFEQYYFQLKRRNNLMGVGLLDIAWLAVLSQHREDGLRDNDILSSEEFWSIPKIKSLTHSISRVIFIVSYSWFTLYSAGWTSFPLKILLFWYGLALGAIEILQMLEKGSVREYFKSGWNVLDVFMIGVLLMALLLDCVLVPFNILSSNDILFLHAFNLLPCYCRLLQMLELSEYFGTLFITFFDMYRDTLNFMGLLSIVAFGFSCALTPMLWTTVEDRWKQGVFWTFWAIFGDVEDEKKMEVSTDQSVFAFLIYPLRYSLYLTLNVLLVNLLIAQMSDTFASNKEESKRVWSYQCVDAVLEFASPEAHPMPPPLDLRRSLQTIVKKWNEPPDGDDENELGADPAMRQQSRQEKRAIQQLQLKVIKEETKEDEENTVQEAMQDFERKIRVASGQIEKMGEIAGLREEVTDLKKQNAILEEENKKLKEEMTLAAPPAPDPGSSEVA